MLAFVSIGMPFIRRFEASLGSNDIALMLIGTIASGCSGVDPVLRWIAPSLTFAHTAAS
jgi:hypothetical protein